MSIYQNLMNQLTDKGALFNVSTDSVVTGNGRVIPKKKAIINESNGSVLGIVGENYKVVSNEEIFDSFCRSIEASDMDTEGATASVAFANDGARTMVDFIFPNETIKVHGDDSITSLSLTALNSFDRSTRYITKAGGFRLKCLNGQLLGDIVGSYSSTHSPKLDVRQGAARIITMLKGFRNAEEHWSSLMRTNISMSDVRRVIETFFNVDDEFPFRNKNADLVWNLWTSYSREMGHNAYALYNAFTDYISHKESKSGVTARMLNEQKLTKILNTHNVFNSFAEAA